MSVKCCVAPIPDVGVWKLVRWRSGVRESVTLSAEELRDLGEQTEFRLPLCGNRGTDPYDIVEDPREVTCTLCTTLLSGKRVHWHNALLAKARAKR
jgi:hypothetical protein